MLYILEATITEKEETPAEEFTYEQIFRVKFTWPITDADAIRYAFNKKSIDVRAEDKVLWKVDEGGRKIRLYPEDQFPPPYE